MSNITELLDKIETKIKVINSLLSNNKFITIYLYNNYNLITLNIDKNELDIIQIKKKYSGNEKYKLKNYNNKDDNNIFICNKYINKLIINDSINNIRNIKYNDIIYVITAQCRIKSHYTLNNFIKTDYYKTRVKSRDIIDNDFKKLHNKFKYIIIVDGDGKCYYRCVLYNLLISIFYLDIPNNESYIESIRKLLIFFKNHEFFNKILQSNGQPIPYIDFLILYSKYDDELIHICKENIVKKMNDIKELIKDSFNTSFDNYLNNLMLNSTYAKEPILQWGILPGLLGCSESFTYTKNLKTCTYHQNIKYENNTFPPINIILIGIHYHILIPK